MSLKIVLHTQHPVYTNLDVVSGTVILSLGREEPFTAITVKLECESKTRLSATRPDGRRQDVEFELHKLLYRTQTVYPTPQLVQAAAGMRSPSYVLQPGEHQFPFQFKFPFNNNCAQTNTMMMMGQDFNKHVKQTLPPNLTGFPGEASIRYFVKVTAQRAGIFKENYRQEIDLKFVPIEPPRVPPNKRESYARRQHQFSPAPVEPVPGGFFRKPSIASGPPPRISIDGRLPDPAIITANESVPLRILIKKLNETPEIVWLKSFHIVLVGFTRLRARDLERVEQNTWVIASHANLQQALGNSNTPMDKDVEIENSMWANKPLPSSVSPSFETCNLVRWYELRVEVGLGWGTPGNMKPELSVQSLRMPVQIYSGIKPPEQLLSQMNQRPHLAPQQQSTASIPQTYIPPSSISPISPGPSVTNGFFSSQHPQQHFFPQQQQQQQQQIPAHITHQQQRPHDPEGPIDDPPPSYEDAIAESLPPVNGQRRDYDQPANPQAPDVPSRPAQSKGDRLFGGS